MLFNHIQPTSSIFVLETRAFATTNFPVSFEATKILVSLWFVGMDPSPLPHLGCEIPVRAFSLFPEAQVEKMRIKGMSQTVKHTLIVGEWDVANFLLLADLQEFRNSFVALT